MPLMSINVGRIKDNVLSKNKEIMAQYNYVDVRVDLYNRSRLCDDGLTKLCESGILDPPLIIILLKLRASYSDKLGSHYSVAKQFHSYNIIVI